MTSALPPVGGAPPRPSWTWSASICCRITPATRSSLARGKGCYVYDLEGRRYLDLHLRHRRQRAGPRASAHPEGDPRAGRPADPFLQPLLPPVPGTAGQTAGRDQRPASAPSSPTPAPRPSRARSRWCTRHGRAIHPEKFEIISLDNSFHGRTLGALSITGQAKYRQRFRAADSGREVRSRQRHRGAGGGLQRAHRRHRSGDDPGRRRHLSAHPRIRRQGARAGRPLQRPAGGRRNPMRRGPAGHLLRLPALAAR